jgi:hypothetical protein
VKKKIPAWKDGLFPWQLDIVAWVLDGEDVLCVTATGDGKSALFTAPIIVLLEVAANPTAYPGFVNYKKPVGLVISPTKGLSANMVSISLILRSNLRGLMFIRSPSLLYTAWQVLRTPATPSPKLARVDEFWATKLPNAGGPLSVLTRST